MVDPDARRKHHAVKSFLVDDNQEAGPGQEVKGGKGADTQVAYDGGKAHGGVGDDIQTAKYGGEVYGDKGRDTQIAEKGGIAHGGPGDDDQKGQGKLFGGPGKDRQEGTWMAGGSGTDSQYLLGDQDSIAFGGSGDDYQAGAQEGPAHSTFVPGPGHNSIDARGDFPKACENKGQNTILINAKDHPNARKYARHERRPDPFTEIPERETTYKVRELCEGDEFRIVGHADPKRRGGVPDLRGDVNTAFAAYGVNPQNFGDQNMYYKMEQEGQDLIITKESSFPPPKR